MNGCLNGAGGFILRFFTQGLHHGVGKVWGVRTKAVFPSLQAVRAPRGSEGVPHPAGPPPLFPEKFKKMHIFTPFF